MKIKSSVGKNVNAAVANCRKVLVEETINLLKSIGAENGDDVYFKRLLLLHGHKGNTTDTMVCKRIVYNEGKDNRYSFFIVSMENGVYTSSIYMSIDNLMAVYNAVREVVREE